ncbi:hypothetical protein C2I19_11030 [Chromobacterium alticapitis]|uniref:Uncharacterized protein n=2 Tax=Chromobacterium alticapitis TaxID=2073169 RepID=A0A2S5DG02_9NEIS|nr:hypothetical protein C2I19_11030 [Chromobacterium alticapitis]
MDLQDGKMIDPNDVFTVMGNGAVVAGWFVALAIGSEAVLTGAAIYGAAMALNQASAAVYKAVHDDFKKSTFDSSWDPLAIDLTGSGIHTLGADQSGVMFDTNGSGNTEQLGWIAQGTGLLVYDPNGTTTLTSGTQLFGNSTLLPQKIGDRPRFLVSRIG